MHVCCFFRFVFFDGLVVCLFAFVGFVMFKFVYNDLCIVCWVDFSFRLLSVGYLCVYFVVFV